MNAILMSIQPKWCELIASGRKTLEVRKTKPQWQPPFKVYIYCLSHVTFLNYCLLVLCRHLLKIGRRAHCASQKNRRNVCVGHIGRFCIRHKPV